MTTFNEMIVYDVCGRPRLCGGNLRDLGWRQFLFMHIYQFEDFWEGFFSCTLLLFGSSHTALRAFAHGQAIQPQIKTGGN